MKKILYVTMKKRNRWNGTLHKPLQERLLKTGKIDLMYEMPPIGIVNSAYRAFFTDTEKIAKNWHRLKIPKVVFMEDVWSPKGTHSKSKSAGRMWKWADALMMRYESMFVDKMKKLEIKWKQPIYFLPHCVDPKIFKDWGLKKVHHTLSVGTLGHKLTMKVRKHFNDTMREKYEKKHFRAEASKRDRKYQGVNFSKIINKSKITGTSNTHWQVLAKCFEIPASRSLMFCNYSKDMEKYGFVDGETFVEFDDENLAEKADYYLNNPKELQRVTDAGYNLVHERHTVHVRAQEWLQYMEETIERK